MPKKRAKRTTRISRTAADKFGQMLDNLPEKQPASLTPKALVFEKFEQLSAALEKGYDYDDLVGLLAKENIQLSATTFRQYMSEARRATSQLGHDDKAAVPEKKVTPPKGDRVGQPAKKTSQQSPAQPAAQPAARPTEEHPETSPQNAAPAERKSHLPSALEIDFDDDPELVEMADVL